MATPTVVTDETFQEKVLNSNTPTLVDFWAIWCGPCRMVAPVIEALAEEYDGKAKIGKVNVDENPRISQRFGIRSIPTLMVFKNGQLKETAIGVRPKAALEQLLSPYV